MEPKGCHNEPRDLQKHPLGNRVEKAMKRGCPPKEVMGQLLIKIEKNTIQKIINKLSSTNIDFYPKREKRMENLCPNSSKIYAKTCNEKDHDNHRRLSLSDV